MLLATVELLLAFSFVSTCQDGWVTFRNSCYLFIDDALVTWPLASQHCASHGAHLASIETADEETFLRGYSDKLFRCGRNHTTTFWVGGTDAAIEGIWTWQGTGKPLTYFDWWPGQPENNSKSEDCLCLFGNHAFHWHDAVCFYEKFHYICEQADDAVPVIG